MHCWYLLLASLHLVVGVISITQPTAVPVEPLVQLEEDHLELVPLDSDAAEAKHGCRPRCCGCPTNTGRSRVRVLSQQYIQDLLAGNFAQAAALQSPLMPAPQLVIKCVTTSGCCIDQQFTGLEDLLDIGSGAYQMSSVQNIREHHDGSITSEATIGMYVATGSTLTVTIQMRWEWQPDCQLKLIMVTVVDVPCAPGTASTTWGCTTPCYGLIPDATTTFTSTFTTTVTTTSDPTPP